MYHQYRFEPEGKRAILHVKTKDTWLKRNAHIIVPSMAVGAVALAGLAAYGGYKYGSRRAAREITAVEEEPEIVHLNRTMDAGPPYPKYSEVTGDISLRDRMVRDRYASEYYRYVETGERPPSTRGLPLRDALNIRRMVDDPGAARAFVTAFGRSGHTYRSTPNNYVPLDVRLRTPVDGSIYLREDELSDIVGKSFRGELDPFSDD